MRIAALFSFDLLSHSHTRHTFSTLFQRRLFAGFQKPDQNSEQLRDTTYYLYYNTRARCTLYSYEYVRHSIASSSTTCHSVVQEPLNHVTDSLQAGQKLKLSTTIMHSAAQQARNRNGEQATYNSRIYSMPLVNPVSIGQALVTRRRAHRQSTAMVTMAFGMALCAQHICKRC
jgi:hypothetical protein